jgi:hypothetical protein
LEAIQYEIETDLNMDDMAITDIKKLWRHAKLECGIVELYSQNSLIWYHQLINNISQNVQAWSHTEKPDPRLKVWINSKSNYLTPQKYVEFCLRYHSAIKKQARNVESAAEEEAKKTTVYLRFTHKFLAYLYQAGGHIRDKFTVKGFGGQVTFATAKEALITPPCTVNTAKPSISQSSILSSSSRPTNTTQTRPTTTTQTLTKNTHKTSTTCTPTSTKIALTTSPTIRPAKTMEVILPLSEPKITMPAALLSPPSALPKTGLTKRRIWLMSTTYCRK